MNLTQPGNYFHFLILLLFVSALPLQAQVLRDEVHWNSAKSVNLNTGDTLAFVVNFVSQENKIDMVQGEYTMPFFIQSIQGTWNDIALAGALACVVKDDAGTSGQIILGRDSAGLYIIVDMTPGNPDGVNRRFIIDSHQQY